MSDNGTNGELARTPQACVKCRSLKIKCVGGSDPPCVRCRRTGSECYFTPRINAAIPPPVTSYPSHACTEAWRKEMAEKISALEAAQQRLDETIRSPGVRRRVSPEDPSPLSHIPEGDVRYGLARSISMLRHHAEDPSSLAWSSEVVYKLWDSFNRHMPCLHFVTGQISVSEPTPILVVAILYLSAGRYPDADCSKYQDVYFQAFVKMMELVVEPRDRFAIPGKSPGQQYFDDVLGIILFVLVVMGWIDSAGAWISIGYRLLLDGIKSDMPHRQTEWRGLWDGIRESCTVELEHCSLKLSFVTLPATPPPFLAKPAQGDVAPNAGTSIGDLASIMQRFMPRFVGKGLPTIWQGVCSDILPVTEVQAQLQDLLDIQCWAAEIDAWYQETVLRTAETSAYTRLIILLNYHLHKVYVLSIFLPFRRGIQGSAAAANLDDLIKSARFLLVMRSAGFEIWSGWDLAMLTHACLVILRAFPGNVAESDLGLITTYVEALKSTNHGHASLPQTLATRIEMALSHQDGATDAWMHLTPTALSTAQHKNVNAQSNWPADFNFNGIGQQTDLGDLDDFSSIFVDHSAAMEADLDLLTSGAFPSGSQSQWPINTDTAFTNPFTFSPLPNPFG